MSAADIAILVSLAGAIGALVTAVIVLYAKLKSAISKIVITDENGKVRQIKVFEIIRIVISAVAVAEQTGKKGAEKKEIAMTTIQGTLNQMGVDYDITSISDSIDTIISLINVFVKKSKKK